MDNNLKYRLTKKKSKIETIKEELYDLLHFESDSILVKKEYIKLELYLDFLKKIINILRLKEDNNSILINKLKYDFNTFYYYTDFLISIKYLNISINDFIKKINTNYYFKCIIDNLKNIFNINVITKISKIIITTIYEYNKLYEKKQIGFERYKDISISLKFNNNSDINLEKINDLFIEAKKNKIIIKYKSISQILNFKQYSKIIKKYKNYNNYILLTSIQYFNLKSLLPQWKMSDKFYKYMKLFNINTELLGSPFDFNLDYFCSFYKNNQIGCFGELSNKLIKDTFFLEYFLGGLFIFPLINDNKTNNLHVNILLNIIEFLNKKSNSSNNIYNFILVIPKYFDVIIMKKIVSSHFFIDNDIFNSDEIIIKKNDKELINILDINMILLSTTTNKNKKILKLLFQKFVKKCKYEAFNYH